MMPEMAWIALTGFTGLLLMIVSIALWRVLDKLGHLTPS